MKISLPIFLLLIAVSITIAWWLFLPLSIVSIFIFKKIYPAIFAGFVLDVTYFGDNYNHFPILLLASTTIAFIFILLENKLRYGA